MRTRVFLFTATLLLVIVTTAGELCAQSPAGQPPTPDQSIALCQQQIASWERTAMLQIILVGFIALIGACITALQRDPRPQWAKTATVVLGIVTTAVTAINSTFDADYRTLRRAATEGKVVIAELAQIDAVLNDVGLKDEDRATAHGDYLKKLLEFKAIAERTTGKSPTVAAAGMLLGLGVPVAYAQTKPMLPPWVQKPPADDISLFYVGTASNESLSKAKSDSLNNAFSSAAQRLQPKAGSTTRSDLLDLVKASAIVQDSTFTFDPSTKSYVSYTLVRIDKSIEPVAASLRGPTVPVQTFTKKNWRPVDLAFNPTSGLFALDSAGQISRLQSGQAPAIEPLGQLKGAYSGIAVAATTDAAFVTAESKLGCTLFRYSLSSRTTAAKTIPNEHCVGIATDGTAIFVSFPESKQIRRWSSWDEAIPQIWSVANAEPLSSLAYDDSGRRLIAAGPTGSAYSVSLAEGKTQLLASNLGYVQAIAVSGSYVLFASGKQILFMERADNRRVNPPPDLQRLTGGNIVGVAVDANNRAWFADYDNKLVEGPLRLETK